MNQNISDRKFETEKFLSLKSIDLKQTNWNTDQCRGYVENRMLNRNFVHEISLVVVICSCQLLSDWLLCLVAKVENNLSLNKKTVGKF